MQNNLLRDWMKFNKIESAGYHETTQDKRTKVGNHWSFVQKQFRAIPYIEARKHEFDGGDRWPIVGFHQYLIGEKFNPKKYKDCR